MLNELNKGTQPVSSAFRDFAAIARAVGKWLLPAAFAFVLARTELPGGMSPLATAFVASAGHGSVISSVLGAVLGSVIPGGAGDGLRLSATAVAVAGIRWALAEVRRISTNPTFPALAALAATVLTGLAVSTSVGAALGYETLTYFCEGLMAGAAAFFLTGAQAVVASDKGLGGLLDGSRALDRQEVCCLAVSATLLALPLMRLDIAGFSPFVSLAMVCTIIVARRWREAGGAVGGIALGLAYSLACGHFDFAGICAIAGLLCALFVSVSDILSAAVFAAACIIGSLFTGTIDVFFIAEATCAAVCACFIGQTRLERWLPFLAVHHSDNAASALRLPSRDDTLSCDHDCSPHTLDPIYTAARLRSAADGLAGVSRTVCEVSERLDKMDLCDEGIVYRRAAQHICADCAISNHCWNAARERTLELFSQLEQPLRVHGNLTRRNAPAAFKENCARWMELCEEINRLWSQYLAQASARRRIAQVRSVVAEQLGGVSELLNELADGTAPLPPAPPELVDTITHALEQNGCLLRDLHCSLPKDGRLSVTLSVRCFEDGALTADELADILSDALSMELEPIGDTDGDILTFSRIPPCTVRFGAAQHMRTGEALCGDAYDAVDIGDRAVMLISDGMGSGGRAAVDAAMTCGLLARLLKAGFGMKGALRVVNSALLVRSGDESLATSDCVQIDLFTGMAHFCKAGASRSFIRHGNSVIPVDLPSLPLGIMREVDCAACDIQLCDGDIVVMVSDGAADCAEDCDWIRAAMLAHTDAEPRALARSIVSLAAEKCSSADDDITALVFQLQNDALSA